jgi:hypothetical protein
MLCAALSCYVVCCFVFVSVFVFGLAFVFAFVLVVVVLVFACMKDICVQYEARMSQGKHVVLEDTKYSREVRVDILVLSRMMTFVLIHSCYFLRFSFLNSTVSGGIKKASRLFRKRWQRSPYAFVSSQKNEIARTSTEGKTNKRIGRSQPSLGVWIGWGEMGERHGPSPH